MAEAKTEQAVRLQVGHDGGKAWIRLSTKGVPPITIPMDPQAAFEGAEQLARAAHMARYGKPAQSDGSYLKEQIKARLTDQMRDWLCNRVTHMLKTIRHSPEYSDRRLAETVVDTVMTKVA